MHFNSQPREGGWQKGLVIDRVATISTHSRAKAAGSTPLVYGWSNYISTHSRAKAAGRPSGDVARLHPHFNSQPREGGWLQAACYCLWRAISTHSRAKAAGKHSGTSTSQKNNFNSQPREGGWAMFMLKMTLLHDFNSQPREGGWVRRSAYQNTHKAFQLTAARRRLAGWSG